MTIGEYLRPDLAFAVAVMEVLFLHKC